MNRALDLNLATQPFRNNTWVWVGHALFALVAVAFTSWNTITFVETQRKLAELRNSVGSIEGRMTEVQLRENRVEAAIAKHDVKYLQVQSQRANDVIRRRALSWTRLFNLLEKVQPYEVKMASIRPVFRSGEWPSAAAAEQVVPVSVEGTARDLHAFLEMERALIADPHFSRVEPERTARSKSGEIVFILTFLYFPDGRAEEAGGDAVPVPLEDDLEGADALEEPEEAPEVAAEEPPGVEASRALAPGATSAGGAARAR